MKVAIDTSPLYNLSKTRGIGIYTVNLIDALKKLPGIEIEEINRGKFSSNVDILHYPYFDFFFLTLPLVKRKKTIVSIHDCTPLVFPQHYPPGIKGKIKFFVQKISLKNVSAVITDSYNSKKDIIKYLNVPEKKINVVYLACSEKFKQIVDAKILGDIRKKYSLPEEFVLYVGDVNYNKNLPGLVKGCRMAKMKLVWVGKHSKEVKLTPHNIEEKPLVEVNELIFGKDDVLRLGFVEEEDLSGIYSLATVYCQPSFYEGFGLQILEAMACKCPVVASNRSSIPEIADEAAVLIDPDNISQIADAIIKLRKNEQLRSKMGEFGLGQVKKFSWSKTAKETQKIYEKVLEN